MLSSDYEMLALAGLFCPVLWVGAVSSVLEVWGGSCWLGGKFSGPERWWREVRGKLGP